VGERIFEVLEEGVDGGTDRPESFQEADTIQAGEGACTVSVPLVALGWLAWRGRDSRVVRRRARAWRVTTGRHIMKVKAARRFRVARAAMRNIAAES
jgi:hypothetical protein